MKKIPTNSFEIIRIVSIIFIVLGLAPIAILLGASIAALFIDGFATFISALIGTIMCSMLLFLFVIFPSFIMKGFCETGISFSEHVSRQTKILEEINKKLDNKEKLNNEKKLDNDEKLDNEKKLDNEEKLNNEKKQE